MGDPFSVAGSAVGVISLGLSVCQGLITYYGQYKSFDMDIHDATSHLENLDCILKALMKTIGQSELQNASLTTEPARIAAKDTIDKCNQKLEELEELLKKCKDTSVATNLSSKFSKSRMLYPFRRDTLLALRESVSWLQDNLGNSLNLLNLALTITDHVQLTSIASISVSTHQSVETIGQRMDQMESNLHLISPQYVQQPAVLQSLLEKTEQLEQHMKTLTLQPHNYLRLPVNEQVFPTNSSSNPSRELRPEGTRRASRSTGKEHLHDSGNNTLTLLRRLSFLKGFVDVAVQVSLKVTVGAGGSSIIRNPMFHATVADDSPAFVLFQRKFGTQNGEFLRMEHLHRHLFELFDSGKASPLDRLATGETLLHVVARWPGIYESDIPSWRALMQSLILAGVSPDEPDLFGSRPGHVLLRQITRLSGYVGGQSRVSRQQELINTCLEFLDSGGVLRIHNNSFFWYVPEVEMLSQIISCSESCDITDFDIPEPLVPLVLRSQIKLERLIKRGVDFRAEIELYTMWPEGLATLLQAGYEADTMTLWTALDSGSYAALKLLRDTGNLDPEQCRPRLADCPNSDARWVVIQELAERRKKLWAVAMTHLPTETLLQLKIQPDTLLGYQAAWVNALLKDNGIETGDVDCRQGWLVYQAANFNTELADQFWDIGFRDVDDMDDQGMTALMKFESFDDGMLRQPSHALLRMASWLMGKGADTGLCPMIYDFSALHFLGAALGCSIATWTDSRSQLTSGYENVVHSILLGNSHDSCYCHCSLGGCTPLVAFLRRLIGTDRDIHYIEEKAVPIMADVFESLSSKFPEIFGRKVVPEVLRLITFRALGLNDTCAHRGPENSKTLELRPFHPEEAREIHEEERDLIEELECLLQDFISDYQRLSLPFEIFLRERWCVRMHEVLSKKEPPSEEVKRQIREIGVILLESESEE